MTDMTIEEGQHRGRWIAQTARTDYVRTIASVNLEVEWDEPVPMRRSQQLIYALDLDKLPDTPGVYVFGRRWGKSVEALYVGKAKNIRSRIKTQTNNLKLMAHIRDASNGGRVVIPGVIKTKRGQKQASVLTLVERALIRHFLLEGHDLVNVSGTKLRQHELVSKRRPMRFVPEVMYLDRGR